MEAGTFDGARRARPVRERVRAGHGATGRALHRYTYTYMYIYTRRERRPERRAEREKNRGTAAARLPKYGRAAAGHHEYEWGAPPRAERSHPTRIEWAGIQKELL